MRIIAAGQGRQRDFLIACAALQRIGLLEQRFKRALTHGTVQHARLAETAATRAAAHNFKRNAVKHRFGIGHDKGFGIGSLVQIQHHAAAHPGGSDGIGGGKGGQRTVLIVGFLVEGGHVYAIQLGQAAQRFQAAEAFGLAGAHALDKFNHQLLAVADLESVDKGGKGLGVIGAGAAGDNQRAVRAILGEHGDVCQIQHFQDVGIAHFVLQGEAHNIKLAQGRAGFDGEQRQVFTSHAVGHVRPGHEDTLAQRPGAAVDDII